MFEYNTLRSQITLKEYGRNIQVMVDNLLQVEDRESRNQQAKNLVELMKQFVQPGIKDNVDLTHKVWDDLFIISEFKLDIDSPFPKPDENVITKKPQRLGYAYSNPVFRHYGRNIELLVKKICEIEDPEEKDNAIIYMGRLMKSFYAQYNKDVVEDIVIKEQMEKLSKGKISIDLERIKSENLFETTTKMEKRNLNEGLNNLSGITKNRTRNNNSNNNNNKSRNNNNKNNNNNRRRK